MKRKRTGLMTAVIASAIAAVSVAAFAESIWIKNEVVEVRSGKGAVYPVVATVKKGTQLNVVERDGKWIKVSVQGASGATEGYVFENAVSTAKVDAGGNVFQGLGGAKMDTAAAAKGLQPTAENYAAGRRLDSGPLNRLIAMNRQIDPKEYERFTREGNVGAK